MIFGYVYKTTNLINDRSYIGKKKKSVFDHTYYGSGIVLAEAIKKYGKENFSIEILGWATTIDELNSLEKQFISQYKVSNNIKYSPRERKYHDGHRGIFFNLIYFMLSLRVYEAIKLYKKCHLELVERSL